MKSVLGLKVLGKLLGVAVLGGDVDGTKVGVMLGIKNIE